MATYYDVTILTVRPGTHPQALALLADSPLNDADLLACWFSEIGAINQILLIRKAADAAAVLGARAAVLAAKNPLGIGDCVTAMAMHGKMMDDGVAGNPITQFTTGDTL